MDVLFATLLAWVPLGICFNGVIALLDPKGYERTILDSTANRDKSMLTQVAAAFFTTVVIAWPLVVIAWIAGED